jgi:hypothetical protein
MITSIGRLVLYPANLWTYPTLVMQNAANRHRDLVETAHSARVRSVRTHYETSTPLCGSWTVVQERHQVLILGDGVPARAEKKRFACRASSVPQICIVYMPPAVQNCTSLAGSVLCPEAHEVFQPEVYSHVEACWSLHSTTSKKVWCVQSALLLKTQDVQLRCTLLLSITIISIIQKQG